MTPQRRFTLDLSPEKGPKFNVVVAYDDDTASSPALKTCDYVIKQLGSGVPVRRTVINLRQQSDRRSAARTAASADMVIVSADEHRELSPEMREWLDEWTGHRSTEEGALVAILNRRGSEPVRSDLREQLRQVATAAHMDFFSSEVSSQ